MIDIHAHLLPNVDDGARSEEEACAMLDEAAAAGVTCIVATPHVYAGQTLPDVFLRPYLRMAEHARAREIELVLGAEVNIRAALVIKDIESYCFYLPEERKRYLLLELDSMQLSTDVSFLVSEWVQRKITPVIAHPERYRYVQSNPRSISEMRSYGCLAQIDARAFLKPFWHAERRTAQKLLGLGMVDCIASDAHRPEHYQAFAKVAQRLGTKLPTGIGF